MKTLRVLGFFAAFTFASTPVLAEPALWVTKSASATVYLFGTIHVLPAGADWHFPMLERALAVSDSLYVEADDASHAKVMALILKYGVDPEERANGKLVFDKNGVYPKSVYRWGWHDLPIDGTQLRVAAERAGIPGGLATLEPMQPWVASLALATASTRKAGYEPRFGVDTLLEQEFRARGKPVHSFESAHEQIRLFADTPPPTQLSLLRDAIDQRTKGSTQINEVAQDWQSGDVEAIASTVNDQLRNRYPGLYQVLLVARNRDFARQISTLLTQSGTVFVAIGAGHLAGPDSVQAQLAKLGIRTERVH